MYTYKKLTDIKPIFATKKWIIKKSAISAHNMKTLISHFSIYLKKTNLKKLQLKSQN